MESDSKEYVEEEEESEEASPAPAEEETSEFVTTESPEAVSNDGSSVLELIKLFAPLVILIAAPVIGIIFIRSLNKDDSGKKKAKKEKKAKKLKIQKKIQIIIIDLIDGF